MTSEITIRNAAGEDRNFIFSLSPSLAEVAGLHWHTGAVVQKMQDDYITEMLAPTDKPNKTLIAEKNGVPLGFIHMRTRKDEISGEISGTVPLLAVSRDAQGSGVGRLLVDAAANWSKEQGFRLLHLEVFTSNHNARGFYENLGFESETIHMIRQL